MPLKRLSAYSRASSLPPSIRKLNSKTWSARSVTSSFGATPTTPPRGALGVGYIRLPSASCSPTSRKSLSAANTTSPSSPFRTWTLKTTKVTPSIPTTARRWDTGRRPPRIYSSGMKPSSASTLR